MITLAICLATGFSSLYATTKEVHLSSDNIDPKGHRNEIPTVRYDDDRVTVSADTLMTDVRITITDRQGQVMASRQAALAPGMPVTLSVTDTPDCGKQTIEIIVDKQKYVGYFE